MTGPAPGRRSQRAPQRARLATLALVLLGLLGASAVGPCEGDTWAVYRLGKGSQVQEGCFGPCMCPLRAAEDLRGALLLEPVPGPSASPFREYRVSWLLWRYGIGTGWTRVTGQGSYRVGGEVAIAQQLVLDLRVGDEPPQRYDSGLVPGGSDRERFPPITIELPRDGRACYDRVFTIVAAPVGWRPSGPSLPLGPPAP